MAPYPKEYDTFEGRLRHAHLYGRLILKTKPTGPCDSSQMHNISLPFLYVIDKRIYGFRKLSNKENVT